MFVQSPLPTSPVTALEPFRIANQYGLFAVMTRGRYEIEFQGSAMGRTGRPIRFATNRRILNQPPGIYAPYQPRFDWNLWFASLGFWRAVSDCDQHRVALAGECSRGVERSSPEILLPQAPPRSGSRSSLAVLVHDPWRRSAAADYGGSRQDAGPVWAHPRTRNGWQAECRRVADVEARRIMPMAEHVRASHRAGCVRYVAMNVSLRYRRRAKRLGGRGRFRAAGPPRRYF